MASLKPIDDLIIQVKRLIGTVNAILERYARLAEEYDSIRLAILETRELLADYFEESGRWADGISRRMDRQERLDILDRTGNAGSVEAKNIRQDIANEHRDRTLREEISAKQELLSTYQRNLDKIGIRIAKFGSTVKDENEQEDYQREVDKLKEQIERMREALK